MEDLSSNASETEFTLGTEIPTNASCSPYDSPDYARVALASALSASVSLIAASFVVFVIIFFKKWKFTTQRLVLYLAISSLLASISTIVHRVDYQNQTTAFYTNFCTFGGFFEQVTSWMVLNAIMVITTYLFVLMAFQKDTKKLEMIVYIPLVFVFPLLISLIPFVGSSYGRSGAWCWIRTEERGTCDLFSLGQYFIFALWFVPVHVLLAVLIIMYIIVLICIRPNRRRKLAWEKKMTEEDWKKNRKHAIRLVAYPFIYILLSCFPLMNRIQSGIERGRPSLVFWYMSAIAFPLAGGLIGLAYVLDPKTRRRLTRAHFQAAFREWRKTDECSEYPINLEREPSLQSHYILRAGTPELTRK